MIQILQHQKCSKIMNFLLDMVAHRPTDVSSASKELEGKLAVKPPQVLCPKASKPSSPPLLGTTFCLRRWDRRYLSQFASRSLPKTVSKLQHAMRHSIVKHRNVRFHQGKSSIAGDFVHCHVPLPVGQTTCQPATSPSAR